MSSIPNLYKFLTICVVEKRGNHCLNQFDDNAKIGTMDDINFIHKYIQLALICDSLPKETIDFLKEYEQKVANNLMVHLTRDCQVIETNRHYVTLIFKVVLIGYTLNISFRTKFSQQYNVLPVGDNTINITYWRDISADITEDISEDIRWDITEDIKTNSVRTGKECYDYIVEDNQGLKYYRTNVWDKNINILEDIITKLPSDYMIPINYSMKPRLKPDACLLS